MLLQLRSLVLPSLLALALPVCARACDAPDRLTSPIVASVRSQTNPVHPLATRQNDRGRVASAKVFQRMVLLLQGSGAQKASLAQLLKDQQDAKSPQFHKWLTPAQFGERFGPSANDMAKVAGWLTAQGFSVEKPSNGRRFLVFTGSSAQVESAFQTEMHSYGVSGKTYFANAKPASIPAALVGVVQGVWRLNGFNPARAEVLLAQKPQTLTGGLIGTTPADLQAIYNSTPLNAAGMNGEGQSVALIEQSNIDPQDVIDFRTVTKLPAAKLNIIVNGPDPGLIGDETEAIADVSYAGAFVPNATLNFVVSASTDLTEGIDLSTVYAVDNLVSPITSLSYGGCETVTNTFFGGAALYALAWEQGAAEGISHFVSSGDNGGDSCGYYGLDTGFGVNILGSTPFNVSVGGTEFLIPTLATYFPPPTYTATGYIPESAWNDYENPLDGRSIGGGGGASIVFPKPYWQAGPGVPADGARDLPDVSLVAGDNLFYILCERDAGADCSQGEAGGVIGTSLAAPSWASIQALVNQKNGLVGGAGNPNPTYYALAAGSNSPFHDITVGDNKVPDFDGALIGYAATPGYDLATGLGSVDVNKLATAWMSPTGTGVATVVLSADKTHITHGDTVNTTTTVTGNGSVTPTGDLAVFAGSEGVAQTILSASGTSSFSFSAANQVVLPGGTYNLKAHYAGDPAYAPEDSNLFAITVDPEPTTTFPSVSPATGAVYGQAVTFAASTTGNNSGTGAVAGGVYTFTENGTAIGTASVPTTGESFSYVSQNFAASLTFEGTKSLGAGTHIVVVTSPPASASFLASTSTPVSVTIAKAPVIFSLAVDHTSPAAGSPVNLTANALADYFGTPVTGNVDFYDGQAKIGTMALGTKANALGEFFATYSVPAVTAGLHNYVAVYDGDANNFANQSGSVNVTAGLTSTITTLTSFTTDTLVLAGTSVTLQALIAGDTSGAAPTGTLSFTDTNSATPVILGTATVTGGGANFSIATLAKGRHNVIATYSGDKNFAGSVSGVAIVRVADFTLAATPSTASVAAGQTTSSISLAYAIDYDIASYGGNPTVTFACSGLPTGAACNFTNTSVTPTVGSTGAVAAADALTISTTGPTLTKASLDHPRSPSHRGLGTALAGVFLLGLPLALRRRLLSAGAGVLLLCFACCLNGCGGGGGSNGGYNASGGTPAGSSTVTVTATVTGGNGLGTLSHTATVALTVTSAGN